MPSESELDKSRIGRLTSPDTSPADPQVKKTKTYTPRRSFTKPYKARILAAYEACETPSARGELLRREGIYHSTIASWRIEKSRGKLNDSNQENPQKNKVRVDHLTREIEQLKKKLSHAEAIIDLQKKVSALFGNHILPLTNSEEKPW